MTQKEEIRRLLRSNGQVTIPKPLREKLELKMGDLLVVSIENDAIIIRRLYA